MEFNPNKSTTEAIKKGAFGRTYFRDIYSGVKKSGTVIYGKNLMN